MEPIHFYSYEEARDALRLKLPIQNDLNGTIESGLESVKLIMNTQSYNYQSHDFRHVYVVGYGRKSSPGHPINHQRLESQQILNVSNINRNKIHVFHELSENSIVYYGVYVIDRISNKLADAGWVYVEMMLTKAKNFV